MEKVQDKSENHSHDIIQDKITPVVTSSNTERGKYNDSDSSITSNESSYFQYHNNAASEYHSQTQEERSNLMEFKYADSTSSSSSDEPSFLGIQHDVMKTHFLKGRDEGYGGEIITEANAENLHMKQTVVKSQFPKNDNSDAIRRFDDSESLSDKSSISEEMI